MLHRLKIAASVTLFLCMVMLVVSAGGCSCNDRSPASPAAPEIVPAGKVLLIGLDGADWMILDRLERAQRIPNLARLRREGAWGVLRSEPPLLSPVVWTSIATGRSPVDHGIVGFLTVRDGKTEPVRSDERQVRAFWNILSNFGLSVGVTGWYASWPAEEVQGYQISDRIGAHQVGSEAEAPDQHLVYPVELFSEIEPIRRQITEAIRKDQLGRFFNLPRGGGEVLITDDQLDTFLGIVRTTELYRAVVPALVGKYDPDLTAVYFEGTDAVGHLFSQYEPPLMSGVGPDQAAVLGVTFERFYEYIDSVLGDLLSGIDRETTTVLVVSDHGFKSGDARPGIESVRAGQEQAALWHRPEGVILGWGRGVRPGVQLPESSIYDVVPTMFRYLGVPLALKLSGRPIDAMFTDELLQITVESVEDYELSGDRRRASDADLGSGETMAKLRALGYVGGGAGDSSSGEAGIHDGTGQSAVPLNRYNLGMILLQQEQDQEALAVFRELVRTDPDNPFGYLGTGIVQIRRSDFSDAVDSLETAVRLGPKFGVVHATLGEAYMYAGRTPEAERSFLEALNYDRGDGRTAFLLGRMMMNQRRFGEAGPHLRLAADIAEKPQDRAGALVGLGILAEEGRDFEEALRLYGRALALSPQHGRALERSANLMIYQGRYEEALPYLANLVTAYPDNAGMLAMQGRALASAGRSKQARQVLSRALALDPERKDIRRMLDGLPGIEPNKP
jgi:predicted AlkP superfamily phosphohydrolase/phosphomutase/Flp pilus assembly protein TadD